MKALIALLLIAFAYPVDSQPTLPVWGFSYGAQEPLNANLNDSMYCKLAPANDFNLAPCIVWDLGKEYTSSTLRTVAFIAVIDSGVELTFASSYDLRSFFVLPFAAPLTLTESKLRNPLIYFQPQIYYAQFQTEGNRPARYLSVLRYFHRADQSLNGTGNALIDCAFGFPNDSTMGVNRQVTLDNSKPTVWYDLLGRCAGEYPTRSGIYVSEGRKLEVVR